MVKIIADPGSCHLGEYKNALRLIRTAKECGADAIKFQLFPRSAENDANILVPPRWVPELKADAKDVGIELLFSVWGMGAATECYAADLPAIKFAFSQRNETETIKYALTHFSTVYVSGDVFTTFLPGVVRLYCIPLYPVPFLADLSQLFERRFDGFSSHCLGISQDLAAIGYGAKVIEKHLRLEDSACDSVPDGRFALMPKDFYKLCRVAKDAV